MDDSDIIRQRLFNQRLTKNKLKKPEDVVSWLGAVQSQDYGAAKWSLALRMEDTTDEAVEKAFNEGRILRTHIMRPTWHFVMPQDIRWMQELTAPRVKAKMAHYNRKLGLDDRLFNRSNEAIVKSLQSGNYLTRQELKARLTAAGIETNVQRLAHMIMWAELYALICSGPRRGRQSTYALLEDRIPVAKKLDRDEALAKLTLKYFTSHGPAQLKDFVWWSGLTVRDAREGLAINKSKLTESKVGEKTYWSFGDSPANHKSRPEAYLMSVYDEYFIGYNDRSVLMEVKNSQKLPIGNALLTSLIIIDGKVTGTWKRVLRKSSVEIIFNPFTKLSQVQTRSLRKEIEHYGQFLNMPLVIKKY